MLKKLLNIFKSPEPDKQILGTENLQYLELRRLELENQYQNVGDFDPDTKIATVHHNDRVGFINFEGKFIYPLFRGHLTRFSEGKGSTFSYIDNKYIIEVIDKEANILKRFDNLYHLGEFKNNQAIARTGNGLDGKYGKINSSWETVIPFVYGYMRDLNDDAMEVSYNGSWRIINSKNKFITPPIFKNIRYIDLEKQRLVGYRDKGYGVFDFKGNQIKDLGNEIEFKSERMDDGQYYLERCGVLVLTNRRYTQFSLVDKDFNTIVPFREYSKIGFINEDMIGVVGGINTKNIDENGYAKWGFLNIKGEVVIPMKFGSAGYFKEGVCVVGINNKYGYADKYGYINKSGDFIIDPIFDYATPFKNGFAKVKINNEFYIIDKTGKKIMTSKA